MMMTNQETPLVTIAIPTYNRASSYLPFTLKSALDQSYRNLEIIVSDNCSSDSTEQFLKSFSDSRIRYIRHAENIGAPNNWNFCISEARGVYLLLLQDDDMIDPGFIEVCMKAVKGNVDVGTIRTGLRLIDSQGKVIAQQANLVRGLSNDDFVLAWMKGRMWPYLCNTLLNTKRLQGIGGLKSKHNLFCDVTAVMRLSIGFGRIDIEDIKASARQHDEERTFSAKVIDWCEDSLEVLDLLCEIVPANRDLIRHEGMKFFSRINYHMVKAVRSPWQKYRLYFTVFKKFNYAFSPIAFLAEGNFLFGKFRSLVRRVKALAIGVIMPLILKD